MGQIADTNAMYLGGMFPELGVRHVHRQTVGDNFERITEALRLALSRADVVVTIGGLGPTIDDITREAIAEALGDRLTLDMETEEKLRQMWTARKLGWNEVQLRQAMRPTCGEMIENPNGSAPGLKCTKNGKTVIALPGPPGEFVPMANGPVRAFLQSLSHGELLHSKVLRVAGIGEGAVQEKIRGLTEASNPTVAPYAKVGEVHLRISARAPDRKAAEELIRPVEAEIRAALGDCVYGSDEETLELATIRLLRERGKSVATAESMTGGWLAERLSSVPGSSEVFKGGVVAYTVEAKAKLLGIDARSLADPVSPNVAEKLARSMIEKMGADFGIGITGNAGPTSDRGAKPVGLAYIAVWGPLGGKTEELHYRGVRQDIRYRATQSALHRLRVALLRPSK